MFSSIAPKFFKTKYLKKNLLVVKTRSGGNDLYFPHNYNSMFIKARDVNCGLFARKSMYHFPLTVPTFKMHKKRPEIKKNLIFTDFNWIELVVFCRAFGCELFLTLVGREIILCFGFM